MLRLVDWVRIRLRRAGIANGADTLAVSCPWLVNAGAKVYGWTYRDWKDFMAADIMRQGAIVRIWPARKDGSDC